MPNLEKPPRGQTLLVGVAGGSGAGKTTLALALSHHYQCPILAQDHYYIDQSARFTGDGESVNFDHPSAIDFPLLARHLEALSKGEGIEVPQYCFITHTRKPTTEKLNPAKVVVVDGTLLLAVPEVNAHLHFTIFVGTDESLRYARRLKRDVEERGRTPEGVKKQFERQVKPMHDQFVEPSKQSADLVIVGEGAIDEMVKKVVTLVEGIEKP